VPYELFFLFFLGNLFLVPFFAQESLTSQVDFLWTTTRVASLVTITPPRRNIF